MDLNLAELGGIPETATLCGSVIDVLKQLVPRDAGSYLLVFWTQIGAKVEAVANMLYERLEPVEGIPCPIAVLELAKGPFILKEPKPQDLKAALKEFYSELHNNINELGNAVKDVVARDLQLCALSSWESRASVAAAQAVNEVYTCAKGDVARPTQRTGSIQKVLAKIAVAAAGQRPASESPARALDAGMADILADQFGASVERAEYKSVIEQAIGETLKNDIGFQDNVNMFATLNTFFHVDTEASSIGAGDRGVVISAQPFNKGHLGFRPADLLTSEFVIPHELYPAERRDELMILLSAFKRLAEFVLVELSADCDHAQNAPRTRRYLLGLEVPAKFFELVRFHNNKKLRSESLQLLGPWSINNEVIYLLVSCGRFWTWQERKPHELGHVKYRLRASIVNKLLHHYSAWSSRPGIVEFRDASQ